MNENNNIPDDRGTKSIGKVRLRFGMLDILLMMAVIATWTACLNARRAIPELEAEVALMQAMTSDVQIIDDSQLCIRELPGLYHNIQGWKYFLPEGARQELRFATEQINDEGDPARYEAIPLPTGVHSLHLKYQHLSDGEFVAQMFLDREEVLRVTHPQGWAESGSSSSSGNTSATTKAFALTERLLLRRMKLHARHPQKKYLSNGLPEDYDSKGALLWIVPQGSEPEVTPDFVWSDSGSWPRRWGHRQGIRIVSSGTNPEMKGLIGIEPDYRLAMRKGPIGGLSIRPVSAECPHGESPEERKSFPGMVTGSIRQHISTSLESPDVWGQGRSSYRTATSSAGAISADGKTMRYFVHFEPFLSGAKPIVEIILDVEHPQRIGLRLHQAEDSIPLSAIQIVSKLNAMTLLRQVRLRPEQREAESPEADAVDDLTVSLNSICDAESDAWQSLDTSRFPLVAVEGETRRVAEFSSDISNFVELAYPAGVSRIWEYDGMPMCQKWYLPANDDGQESSVAEVDVRLSATYPDTDLPLVGGSALQDLRITVPLPATETIWLEWVAAEQEQASDPEVPDRTKQKPSNAADKAAE